MRTPFISFSLAISVTLAFASVNLCAVEPPPAQPVKPLAEKDYTEFGRKLEDAATKGDQVNFDKLVSIVDIFERTVKDLGFPEKERKSMLRGAESSKKNLSDQILTHMKNGGCYSLLRVHEVEGRKRVLMRFITEDGSVNYHDFILTHNQDGLVVAEDMYVFMNCEMISQTFRRMLLLVASDPKKGIAAQLRESDQLLVKNIKEILKMTAALKEGRSMEALSIFRKLPDELQKEKAFQLIAIQAAQGLDDAEYLGEIERFRKNHPKDATIDFLAIDYYFLKKKYDEVLKAIEKLDKSLGGDSYLLILKGTALNQAGRNAEAKPLIEKGIKEGPKVANAYWIRIAIALEEMNHADTLEWLKKIEESGLVQISPETIKESDNYSKFVKSPEYEKLKTWLAERKR
jgi:tetratricopeptide (TPR) repeat protein